MAKKHWIYIKRGLSEDPKHRAAMAECVWLYMHIIDRADWETGIAYDWKDREEAADMGMAFETLRDQRQKLEKLDYIRCAQKQRGQDIRIMEWKNPRDYSSEIKNPRIQSDLEPSPSEFQGDPQGDPQGSSQSVTPTSDSESESVKEGANAQLSSEQIQEITQDGRKDFDTFLMFEAQKLSKQLEGKAWRGRELLPPQYLAYGDWWHLKTGLHMYGQREKQKLNAEWTSAFKAWYGNEINFDALEKAFDANKWRGAISKPSIITSDAKAIQALPPVLVPIGADNRPHPEFIKRAPETGVTYAPPPPKIKIPR